MLKQRMPELVVIVVMVLRDSQHTHTHSLGCTDGGPLGVGMLQTAPASWGSRESKLRLLLLLHTRHNGLNPMYLSDVQQ